MLLSMIGLVILFIDSFLETSFLARPQSGQCRSVTYRRLVLPVPENHAIFRNGHIDYGLKSICWPERNLLRLQGRIKRLPNYQ